MLKVIVKSLDDLDEAIKALYAEITLADGSTAYQLKLQGLNDHSEVISLKNAHEAQKVINRELRTKKEAAEARLDGLPEDFDANAYDTLKAQADAVPGKPDPTIIEAQIVDRVNRATKKLNDDNEALKSDKQKLIDQRNNSHRDIELNEQLAQAGVTDPIFAKAAKAMLRQNLHVIEDDDGSLSVLAKDPELGIDRPASEFIKNWAESDEGKSFVGARDNAGGGAGGNGGGGSDKVTNPWKTETFNLTEQGRINRDDPELAKRLKAAAGK
jgi:hypothetical protein